MSWRMYLAFVAALSSMACVLPDVGAGAREMATVKSHDDDTTQSPGATNSNTDASTNPAGRADAGLDAKEPPSGVAGIGGSDAGNDARPESGNFDAGSSDPNRSGGMAGSAGSAGSQPASGGKPSSDAGRGGSPASCPPGLHACPNGECQSTSNDRVHCGNECVRCAQNSICVNGQCTPCSSASEHTCEGMNRCFENSDALHCGPQCSECPNTTQSIATCEADRCASRCLANSITCGEASGCARVAWDFEDGTVQGWETSPDDALFKNAAGPLRVSTERAHGGSQALAADVKVSVQSSRYGLSFSNSLCTLNNPLDIRGKEISAWFYFDGPSLPSSDCCTITPYVFVKRPNETTSFSPNERAMLPRDRLVVKQWFRVSGRMPADAPQTVYWFTFQASIDAEGWVGTVFIDDVKIE